MSHLKRKAALVAVMLAWPICALALTPGPASGPGVASAPAAVAVPTPAGDPSVARQIRDINERMMLLKAQIEQMTLELQLQQKQAEKSKLSGMPTTGGVGGEREQLPSVQSIEGVDRKLRAKLSFGNGLTQVVSKGDKINGWFISDITASAVVISNGKEVTRLPFGAEPPPAPPPPPGLGVGLGAGLGAGLSPPPIRH